MNAPATDSTSPFVSTPKRAPYTSGPLDGLTFAVKDNIDIEGEVTGYGSPAWADAHPAPVANAICVDQLLGSGATLKGKTKSDELAYSLLGVNHFWGTPTNPKTPERIPGGSSSGSASAVASGLVDFALGTDTGGSVRVPASQCGIWGYRPTHGAISVAGVLALAPSFDTVGVLASKGEVLKKAMEVLIGEPASKPFENPKICFVDDLFDMCHPTLAHALEPIRQSIASHHETRTVTINNITNFEGPFSEIYLKLGHLLSVEIWNTFGAWVTHDAPQLSPGVAQGLKNYAQAASREDIQNAFALKRAFANTLNTFLQSGHILCFPTIVDPAPRLDELTPEFFAGPHVPRAMCAGAISGLASTPQITVPAAQNQGIPAGLSFMAARGEDMALMDLCLSLL